MSTLRQPDAAPGHPAIPDHSIRPWRRPGPPALLPAALAAVLCLTACAQRAPESLAAPAQTTPSRPTAAPALVADRPVSWSELQPLLAEAAGGEILQEIVLDRMLEGEASRRAVRITPEDVQREEATILRALRDTAGADESSGFQLLTQLRRQRGLGEHRYAALLRRTALMRALVQGDVDLSDERLRQAYELTHGERRVARIITVAALPDAQAVLTRLERGEPFAEVAARLSTDATAQRGGLLAPISPADTTYPSALREALRALEPGGVSAPIAIDRGYAILKLEEIIPTDNTSFESVKPQLTRDARLAQERALMNTLADRLLQRASVNVFDPALESAWRERSR